MRSLNKNKQKIWYSTYAGLEEVYERDENDDIIYEDIDGERVPVVSGEEPSYDTPVPFEINIATSGGEAEAKEFGVDASDYQAVLVTTEKTLPIDELSLIWHTSDPVYREDGTLDCDSADYSVLAVKPSLNGMKYLLKQLTK